MHHFGNVLTLLPGGPGTPASPDGPAGPYNEDKTLASQQLKGLVT